MFPQVHSYLTLEPSNTDTWDAWMEPTSQQPLFMKFTFFNVENAEEIVASNVKPRVAEKGAFAYREVRVGFEGKPFMKNFNIVAIRKSFNDHANAKCSIR